MHSHCEIMRLRNGLGPALDHLDLIFHLEYKLALRSIRFVKNISVV